MTTAASRHDWTRAEVEALYERPLNDLLFDAQGVHRRHFDPNRVQISTLLSVKTGACPEDCAYCPQSVHHNTGLERERLLPLEEVVASAKTARAQGATRFCMGAAWRNPTDRNLERVIEMIQAVRDLGMETCVTLGMLREEQARRLAEAGLDYYNHNLDSSPEYYEQVISTRSYSDRQETLANARAAGLNVCCGGIVGMGEGRNDRAGLLVELANQATHPGSVPINMLIQVPGTPLYGVERLDPIEFVRTIAVARLMMPQSYVRLSAGRTDMSDETQALCFFAGANSIFYGEKLLTTENPETEADAALFARLGIQAETAQRERAAGPSVPVAEPAS
jgi:biotin synthase